jgi:hypothetical protein
MVIIAAWTLVVLRLGHTAVEGVLFKKPLADAMRAGFVGQFEHSPDRRAAFWFMIFGPLLIMGGGRLAIRAVKSADAGLLKIMGFYLLAVAALGSLAMQQSPFWVGLIVSLFFVSAGYGWVR